MGIFDSYKGVQKLGMTFGGGGLLDSLGGIFGGGHQRNPYNDASKYYDKIQGATEKYYNPYMQAGAGALGQLQGQYGNLINDPTAMMNKIGQGYHESPGFQWQLGQGMNAAGNAAAAGGMAGSPQHQQQAATMAQGLANQDYHNYLNQGLSQYGQGLHGLEGINQMGFGANDQMARIMADMLSGQGQMAFAGRASQNQSQGDMWGKILGLLGTGAGAYFGGPAGAAAGGAIGQRVGGR